MSKRFRTKIKDRDLEVTTLRYLSVDDMVSAIGLPREKLCLYCWIGEYESKTPEKSQLYILEEEK